MDTNGRETGERQTEAPNPESFRGNILGGEMNGIYADWGRCGCRLKVIRFVGATSL
jgi:hypothetical protein